MTPNQITALRILMGFAAVAFFTYAGAEHARAAGLIAVGLTMTAIVLDAVDGYVARRRKLETPLGAQIDILGDRIIENLYFTFFAVSGLISVWVPLLFFVRGTATDLVRGVAGREGRSGFGRNSMVETAWARQLVASRWSRAAYGTLKCACFCWLGLELSLPRHAAISLVSAALVSATMLFCIVRGLPVLYEGQRYVAALALPLPAKAPGQQRVLARADR
jgi:phosphatidylglycerophosphate synthase